MALNPRRLSLCNKIKNAGFTRCRIKHTASQQEMCSSTWISFFEDITFEQYLINNVYPKLMFQTALFLKLHKADILIYHIEMYLNLFIW